MRSVFLVAGNLTLLVWSAFIKYMFSFLAPTQKWGTKNFNLEAFVSLRACMWHRDSKTDALTLIFFYLNANLIQLVLRYVG